MRMLASACQNVIPAEIVIDLEGKDALNKFRRWASRNHWTRHNWMRDEVLARVNETEKLLRKHSALQNFPNTSSDCIEERPFIASCKIRASVAEAHGEPASSSPVVARFHLGHHLRTRRHRG